VSFGSTRGITSLVRLHGIFVGDNRLRATVETHLWRNDEDIHLCAPGRSFIKEMGVTFDFGSCCRAGKLSGGANHTSLASAVAGNEATMPSSPQCIRPEKFR
jgi:hypothetical protein